MFPLISINPSSLLTNENIKLTFFDCLSCAGVQIQILSPNVFSCFSQGQL